ncbi:MAG: hypothetical protein K0U72_05750 [Gammaproteobacteria bacterium]|nr:hypothetical protein [Gammaproteobacteria bacterium]
MPRPSIQFNDYVSLAVMALMIVALIAGQASAKGQEIDAALPAAAIEEPVRLAFDGQFGDAAVKVSISLDGDSSYFRGEDE